MNKPRQYDRCIYNGFIDCLSHLIISRRRHLIQRRCTLGFFLTLRANLAILASAVCLSALAQTNPTSPPSSLVAIVNGQEISAQELNLVSAGALNGITDPVAIKNIKTQILNNLINQRLAAQKLDQAYLEKNPQVALQLEQLKREGLLNIYIGKQLGPPPQLNASVITSYIDQHPELFDRRRTYHFTEIQIIPTGKFGLEQVQTELSAHGVDGLFVSLKKNQIPYGRTNAWSGTEQIDPATLKHLTGLKDGDSKALMLPNNQVIQVLKLYNSYPDPVLPEDARAAITKGLQQMARDEEVQKIITSLRNGAQVQVMEPSLAAEIEKSTVAAKSGVVESTLLVLEQIRAAWFFALIILVPYALIIFYRQIAVFHRIDHFLDELMDVSESWMFRIPFVLVTSAWLFWPLYNLIMSPPYWMGARKLLTLAIAGLILGIALVLGLWKGLEHRSIFLRRWVPILAILLVQRLMLFI